MADMGGGGIVEYMKVILIMMVFYSAVMTGITHAMPSDALSAPAIFSEPAEKYNIDDLNEKMSESLQSQTNIPVVELGTLIYYSGNILVDFLFNFVFAVPEMIGLFFNGVGILFNLPGNMWIIITLATSVMMIGIYVIGLMQAILNLRGQGRLV